MAKRAQSNAARIERYLEKHPEAPPREIAERLGRYGVTPQYVSIVKSKLRNKDRDELQGNGETESGATHSSARMKGQADVTTQKIIAAAQFIKNCGGPSEAQAALQLAQKIALALK